MKKFKFTLSKVLVQRQIMADVAIKEFAEIKALFIAAVKDRTIKPVGKLSEQVSELIFDVSNTKKYLLQLKHSL